MAAVLGFLLILLALTGHSSATTYCVCKDGVIESALQKDIDYACGNGANCSPIKEKGVCYNPNTAKDHCNYAVNSYYQNKGQAVGSCDFDGTAVTTQTLSGQSSTCVYPTSASGSTTPGTGTTSSTTPGSNSGTGFGIAPNSINGNGNPDNSTANNLSLHRTSYLLAWPFTLLTLFLSILLSA